MTNLCVTIVYTRETTNMFDNVKMPVFHVAIPRIQNIVVYCHYLACGFVKVFDESEGKMARCTMAADSLPTPTVEECMDKTCLGQASNAFNFRPNWCYPGST